MVSFLGQKDIRWCLVFKGCHCYTFTHILKATSVEIFFFSFWLVKSRKELKRAIIMNDLPYAFWWWCHCQSPSYFVPNCLFPILLQRFTDSHKLPHWKNSNRPENSLPLLTGPLRLGFSVLESVFPFGLFFRPNVVHLFLWPLHPCIYCFKFNIWHIHTKIDENLHCFDNDDPAIYMLHTVQFTGK